MKMMRWYFVDSKDEDDDKITFSYLEYLIFFFHQVSLLVLYLYHFL